ncbi:hypothetical protein My1_104 [Pectobacterium phage My1]|uniref:Uncharacterized protein n=1 Tax=Pectobacterium phage My1 TaxID=1204539 RepID=J9QM79_9CAUD|nr:hypothetical protein My1_104 [Pectobacterium phage My1]AFQ22263.1 hypothetical protein My1_104 [Pectobacterium phage My1]
MTDPRWKTRRNPRKKVAPKPEVELCRVLPHRLAHIPGAVEWLVSKPKRRLDTRVSFELRKLYAELASLVKNSLAKEHNI